MTRRDIDNRLQIEFNSVDALVPEDHLIRKIDAALDFNFIYDEVAELYSAFGAPSIDPVVLIKIVMIQYLFGIPSMRQTIREIEVNEILEQANKHGFIDLSEIYIDSTHIKASANKKKYTKKEIDVEVKRYQEGLEKEIDEDRKNHGKKPLKKENKPTETKVTTEINTDPDSGIFFRMKKRNVLLSLHIQHAIKIITY